MTLRKVKEGQEIQRGTVMLPGVAILLALLAALASASFDASDPDDTENVEGPDDNTDPKPDPITDAGDDTDPDDTDPDPTDPVSI
ncbi:hypothetical protein [Loktanella fryxellensis]|nr:hypothetical protein [Loktanella fryxellensis]